MSLYLINEARALGAPKLLLARMIANTVVDGVVGAVPLVGDVFDAAFRAIAAISLCYVNTWIGKPISPGLGLCDPATTARQRVHPRSSTPPADSYIQGMCHGKLGLDPLAGIAFWATLQQLQTPRHSLDQLPHNFLAAVALAAGRF